MTRITDDQVIEHLRKMPDGVAALVKAFSGTGWPVARVTLAERDGNGDRICLVCGVEYVKPDDVPP